MNLFDIPKDDQSLYFLGQIFGNVGSVLTSVNPNGFLGSLFQAINTIALTVGAIVVVYTTVVGLLATAHEGEFLGKKWSGLWVPIRMVIGVASLFPASSGYSMIQIVMMWIIIQGVGAADMLWKNALMYTQIAGSPYAGIGVSAVGVDTVLQNTFQGLVCQQTAAQAASDTAVIKYYNKGYAPSPYTPISYAMGPGGACGTLTTCDKKAVCEKDGNESVSCWACTGQEIAMAQIVDTFNGYAKAFVTYDTQYVKFHDTVGAKPDDWIKAYCQKSGLSDKQCCVMEALPTGECQPKAFEPSFQAPADNPGADISEAGMKFYQTWAMYPLLTGKSAPVENVDANANFIAAASQYYTTSISSYVVDRISKLPTSDLKDWQKEAAEAGWIVAGSYYYKLADMSGANIQGLNPKLSFSDSTALPSGDLRSYRNNFNGVRGLIENLNKVSQESSTYVGPSPPKQMEMVNAEIGRASSEIVRGFMDNLTGSGSGGTLTSGTNEFIRMVSFGHTMLVIAQSLYVGVLVSVGIGLGIAALLGGVVVFGNGFTMSPALEAMKGILSIFSPIFFALLGALFTFGGLLGMYIPFIPYVVFTVTALGWLIATIEAMVAAPIVALGILSPGGQSEVFGKAEPSIMIILNLFLRPALMVFGLMAAMLLALVAIKLVNIGFLGVMGDIMMHPGIVEQFIFIGVYVSLMFVVMNKVFTLIHLIPERVLTYIGGHAIQYGEGEAAAGVKHGVEAAAGGAAAGMKGGVEGGTAGMVGTGKAIKAAKGKDTDVNVQG